VLVEVALAIVEHGLQHVQFWSGSATPYVVKLRDSDLERRERMEAEARFARALEERLGAPDEVPDLLRLLQDAEYFGRKLTKEERRWRASGSARTSPPGRLGCKAWPRSLPRGSRSRFERDHTVVRTWFRLVPAWQLRAWDIGRPRSKGEDRISVRRVPVAA
jgi:hypothetical protein